MPTDRNLRHDNGFSTDGLGIYTWQYQWLAIVSYYICDSINILKECFVIHTNNDMIFIADSEYNLSSLTIGKSYYGLQKANIFLW